MNSARIYEKYKRRRKVEQGNVNDKDERKIVQDRCNFHQCDTLYEQ